MAVAEHSATRDAVRREDWPTAYRLLHAADRRPGGRPLGPDGLTALADAAWWSGRLDEAVAARLRAHAAYVAAGDPRGAGLTAWWLSDAYQRLGRPAAAAGWLRRAHHDLDGRPDCPEQGLLAWTDTARAEEHHDPAAALAAVRRTARLAARAGSADLLALARQAEASLLLAHGRRAEGFALLDAAVAAATAGALSAAVTGRIHSLAAGQALRAGDLRRATTWADTAMAWCARQSPGPHPHPRPHPFRPLCRVHHIAVLDLHGTWTRAEEAVRLVVREAGPDARDAVAEATYILGEIQRRQGRTADAERSYARAYGLGRVPQPGLALLRLGQGRGDAALAGLRLALDCQPDPEHDRLGRARLLAALAETALALGEPATAARAVRDLETLAAPDAPLLTALAAGARGALTRDPAPLRRALALWRELRVPYEAGRIRALLAAG
ncbi:LuxR family transcriptional regulator [Streptomyces sp. SKN60]|uniref:LuxR family transcriptional regulator n=1 Tax=Streptomyces sp. SKN60 TaxID=2855506 RepID=UPI002247BE88|nr:LuxR family transcriptional regulator [Streptomyces sp. SKN60]MCX2179763.1 LuxR family transcriptional regulator [Streptomyces sp. SKN60]